MIKKLIAAAALAGTALPTFAQSPLPDADPAIWAVKDEDTTVYLFGTFHLLDGKQDWFNEEVKTAFDASSELIVEAILPDDPATAQPLIMKYAVDPNGKTLSSKLTPEVKAKLDKTLTAMGVPAQAFEPLEPWFVSTALGVMAIQKLGLKGELGAENVLKRAAKDAGKPVGELESVEKQLAMFDSISEPTQVAFVGETIDSLDKIGETFTPMLTAWSSGDAEKLARTLHEGIGDNPELYRVLMTDRNAKWADWIAGRMQKPGIVFVAVGAGHLAGKGSVQEYLASKGLTAQRVTN